MKGTLIINLWPKSHWYCPLLQIFSTFRAKLASNASEEFNTSPFRGKKDYPSICRQWSGCLHRTPKGINQTIVLVPTESLVLRPIYEFLSCGSLCAIIISKPLHPRGRRITQWEMQGMLKMMSELSSLVKITLSRLHIGPWVRSEARCPHTTMFGGRTLEV